MTHNYTIYALIDPRNKEVRYIGLTQKPLRERLDQDTNDLSGCFEKTEWIRELKKMGIKPLIEAIEENLTLSKANVRETYWIKQYLHLKAPILNTSKVR